MRLPSGPTEPQEGNRTETAGGQRNAAPAAPRARRHAATTQPPRARRLPPQPSQLPRRRNPDAAHGRGPRLPDPLAAPCVRRRAPAVRRTQAPGRSRPAPTRPDSRQRLSSRTGVQAGERSARRARGGRSVRVQMGATPAARQQSSPRRESVAGRRQEGGGFTSAEPGGSRRSHGA